MDLPSVGVSSTGPLVTFGRRRHPETSSPTPPALRSASSTLGSGIAAAIAAACSSRGVAAEGAEKEADGGKGEESAWVDGEELELLAGHTRRPARRGFGGERSSRKRLGNLLAGYG